MKEGESFQLACKAAVTRRIHCQLSVVGFAFFIRTESAGD
jgi:hypothetical protein